MPVEKPLKNCSDLEAVKPLIPTFVALFRPEKQVDEFPCWHLSWLFSRLINYSFMSTLTFGIIKPDAVRAGNAGKITDRILGAGFTIRGLKLIHQTRKQAEGFYAVHAGKGFYDELCDFMSSGPCVVMALEKENAVKSWRDLMGATNPAEAADGTLRKDFASSIGENAVHGSDSDENAAIEISYFFSKLELV